MDKASGTFDLHGLLVLHVEITTFCLLCADTVPLNSNDFYLLVGLARSSLCC